MVSVDHKNNSQADVVEPVEVPSVSAAVNGSLEDMADYLTDGYWNDNSSARHAFASSTITVNLTGLTADGKKLARWAMEAWENVANLTFVETSGSADITFDDNDSGAYATASRIGNTTVSASVNVGLSWLSSYGAEIDSYSFQTYVHEIGHALGLGHQGNYNGSAVYGVHNTFVEDSWQLSLMSYFSQNENTNTNASFAFTATPMMVDILAIQELYGTPTGSGGNSGNTVYGKNANVGGYLETLFASMIAGQRTDDYWGDPVAITIYDQGGTDLIDLSFSDDPAVISLLAGSFSNILGGIGNLAIALNTIIENVNLGDGNDSVTGNDADNVIYGFGGNDTLNGGAGNDRLIGGLGDDTLNGGADNDVLKSKGGNDIMNGNAGDDKLVGADDGNETMSGGSGSDHLSGLDGTDTLNGGSGDDFLYGGKGVDTVNGGDDNDRIRGNRGDDTLDGGDGDDFLYGGGQHDTVMGGNGRDYLYGENGNDVLNGGDGKDNLTGGDGADTFVFEASDTGADKIVDFENGTDKIDMTDFGYASYAALEGLFVQMASGVQINHGNGTIFINNAVLADLDTTDFIL